MVSRIKGVFGGGAAGAPLLEPHLEKPGLFSDWHLKKQGFLP
jgi:hypothetical protein